MSRTPDKPQITVIKISRLQKSERTVTQNRALLTDRKVEEKPQTKVKSPLMIMVLLNKKLRSRIEYSFMKLNLFKNTRTYKKIIAKYISFILKCKVKSNETHSIQKLRYNSKRVTAFKKFCTVLNSWFRMKTHNQKTLGFFSIVSIVQKNKGAIVEEKTQQKYEIPSRPPASTSLKKAENRSLDLGNKSVSSSKLNVAKKIEFENDQESLLEFAKIKKQNEELKLMELSEQAREVLKKVQRFDRFIYAQQTEKICKQILTVELRRLEKIKNSQKEMRSQFYDNELTITALFNHIKLVSEMSRDLNDLSKLKQKYDAQESKRKQEQFKQNLQKKRNRGRTVNTEVIVKQLSDSIKDNLSKSDYDKAKQDIAVLLSKHQKQEAVRERIVFYQALMETISRHRQAQNALDDALKFSSGLASLDFTQNQMASKSLKQIQKEISILINKSMKQEAQNEKLLNIYRSFEKISNSFAQQAEPKNLPQKDRTNTLKSKANQKALEQATKKIAQLQKQLQASKNSISELEGVRTEYQKLLNVNLEFENRVSSILQKVENTVEFKKGLEGLIKDKRFMDEKPYSLMLNLNAAYQKMADEQINSQVTLILNFVNSVISIQHNQKGKSDLKLNEISTLAENFRKLNPQFFDLTSKIQELVSVTVKSTIIQQVSIESSKDQKAEETGNDRTKSKSLNEKSKNFQKGSRQQTAKISSNEKEKRQLQSGLKPPIQSKSQQILKNQPSVALQNELKQSKDKILALEKQLATFKNNEKKQMSQKKETKPDETKKLQDQVKKMQDQAKIRKEKQAQQRIEKNKEVAAQAQLTKSVTSIGSLLEAKNYKQLQIQSNKFLKSFEKDQKFSVIVVLITNLTKLLVERETAEVTKKKQFDAIVESQTKDKQKLEVITKLAKESQAEIKSGTYLTVPDYWDRFLTGLDARSAGVLKDLIKILKQLTIEIKNKSQKLEQSSLKMKNESSSVNNTLQILKNIEAEMLKKQYLKNDEGLTALQNSTQSQDRIVKALFRVVKKISETSRSKLSDERKLNEKSIKSYESELEKMNNFISQYEIKVRQKEHEYQQLYKSFVELQKSAVPQDDQKKVASLRGSRRSARSSSSEKDELKNIKASMQVFAEEEKNMLQRLEMTENEKIALVQRINYLQEQAKSQQKVSEELRSTIRVLQKNISDEHSNYQREYEAWRQKTIAQSQQIENIRNHYERQFESRQEKMVEQFESITKEREFALENYHRDLSNVQNQLNNEITHLREQLRLKNIENLKLEQLDVLGRNYASLEAEYESLKYKAQQFQSRARTAEQTSAKYEQLKRENGQLSGQLSKMGAKNKQYEQQIQTLRVDLERVKSEVKPVNSNQHLNAQIQNALKDNQQLQRKISSLNEQNKQLDLDLKNLKTNLEKVSQQSRSNYQKYEQTNSQLQNSQRQSGQYQVEINNLNAKLRSAEQQTRNLQQRVGTLEMQVKGFNEKTKISSSTSVRVQQLEEEITKLKSEQEQIINNEVITALRNQQEDFNRFLANHEKQIENHFFNIIIPEKIRQVQVQESNTGAQTQLREQISKLNQQLKQKQKQLRAAADTQRNLNEEIRKLNNLNSDLDKKIKNNSQVEERIKRYLVSLQISWEEATTGSLSEKTTALYLRPTTRVETKQVVRQVIKSDPRQEATINDLRLKLDNQIKISTDLEQKYIAEKNKMSILRELELNLEEMNKKYAHELQSSRVLREELNLSRAAQNSLRQEVKRVESGWQFKYNQLNVANEKKIHELIQQRAAQPSRSRSLEEFKIIESKLDELNHRYIQQSRIRTELENKYNLSVSAYELKIQNLGSQKIAELGRINGELNLMRDRNQDLSVRLTQRQNQLKAIHENYDKDLREIEIAVQRKYIQKISYYESRLTECNTEISNLKSGYQNSLNSFNHQDCQRKYREMQQRLNKEVIELRAKLTETSRSGREEIELLKEVINNQKLEFRNFQLMINTFRQAKDEAQRQKDEYFNELKAISNEKDLQIFKLRADYENRLTTMSIQKSTLQSRISQNLQSLQSSRSVDQNSHIKILQLESQINNKNQQIKQVNDLSERRRRELQELHQKLILADRQIENLRGSVNSMENHIMKLEADLSHFNNQVHKYKLALIQTQSREVVLRNDLLRMKTESDGDNNAHLKEQISALKDQIIRITSTNIHQINNLNNVESYDVGRLRKMIYDMESHRNVERYGYNQDEMEILKRINEQVTQLVAANRQLQTKCILLESQLDSDIKIRENIDIFLLLQDRMEHLVNFLLQKSIIDNAENYSKFMYSSNEILSVRDIDGYFSNWLNFMKSLFLLANDLKTEELRQKAEQMIELKEQMNQILDKHIEFVEDESYETLDKFKMIFSDIKILLREFMNTRNQEYIQMIWRSLESHEGAEQHQHN